ncbi:MAG: MBL fold metallo-hydrolase, partial [Bacteroidales bacterium]|nr:MBL fold metallo-hydrolase [Bacteroidales bacterium]
MKFKIHRGTKEIGGSCVEVSTHSTRILLDFGMPLVDEYGDDFNFYPYKDLSQNELIEEGILHNINGLYPNSDNLIDGIVISHAHQDHIGLLGYVHQNIKYYLGAATHEIIKLGNVFNRKDLQLKNFFHFTKSETFNIGDISITPYWNDHSGFDAYSFLLQANGKSIFYSGDFRSHGRKASAFEWLLRHAPQNVDYLLLEGTTIGSSDEPFKTEDELEQEFASLFKISDCINYVWTSSQNIDRLVSIYKACIASNKTFVVDVYTANVLHTLSQFAKLPTPLKDFKQIKDIFPNILATNLYARNHDPYVNKFESSKITKETISANPSYYV